MKKVLVVSVGIVGLVLLSWLCISSRAPVIEEDIRARVGDALTKNSMDWAVVGVDGRDLALEGAAPSAAAGSQAVALAGGIWGVRTVDDRMSVAELETPAEAPVVDAISCQDLFNDLLADRTLLFETASAEIHSDSFPLLDEVVALAKRCPSARIEVAGHADSRGDDDFNLRLSQARAEVVTAYLVRNGVEQARLSAVGYGDTRPVADNENAAGQAKNRRIEFIVRGN